MRELVQQLQALSQVLGRLTDNLTGSNDLDLAAQKLPLRRCGEACKEFEKDLERRSEQSGDDPTSCQEWTKLRFRSGEVGEFRQLLAGYTAAVNIAGLVG